MRRPPQKSRVLARLLGIKVHAHFGGRSLLKGKGSAATRYGRHFRNKEQSSLSSTAVASTSIWNVELSKKQLANLAGVPFFENPSTRRKQKKKQRRTAERYAIRVGEEDSTQSVG